jgi:hypothetical protein
LQDRLAAIAQAMAFLELIKKGDVSRGSATMSWC